MKRIFWTSVTLLAMMSLALGIAEAIPSGSPHSRSANAIVSPTATASIQSTPGPIDALIARAFGRAHQRGLKPGPANKGGVDCVDGCVLFNGLVGNGAQAKFQDLQDKLVLSPKATDYLARKVKELYDQPYTDRRAVGNQQKLASDLAIVFGYFAGATVSLGEMPKGTLVWNTVIDGKSGKLVQFKDRLKHSREYLSIRKDGKEIKVFTTCGNGVSEIPIPSVPKVPPRPQREFVKCPHPGICGSPTSGREQNRRRDPGRTSDYERGTAEQPQPGHNPGDCTDCSPGGSGSGGDPAPTPAPERTPPNPGPTGSGDPCPGGDPATCG